MASDVEGASIGNHFKRPRYVYLAGGIGRRKDRGLQRKCRHEQKIHTLQRLIIGGAQRTCQVLGLSVIATLIVIVTQDRWRTISVIAIYNRPRATPRWRRTGSRGFGETNNAI